MPALSGNRTRELEHRAGLPHSTLMEKLSRSPTRSTTQRHRTVPDAKTLYLADHDNGTDRSSKRRNPHTVAMKVYASRSARTDW